MAPSGPFIGLAHVANLRGIPADAIAIKIRQRVDDVGRVYVRRPARIEEYILLYDDVTKHFYINQHYRVGVNTRINCEA